MKLLRSLAQRLRGRARSTLTRRAKPTVETLESRLVPYAVSGNSWVHPELVSLSFVPDGTDLGGVTSNLQSTFDNHASQTFRDGWRNQLLKAAQVWAQQTNLNFTLVTDDGAALGSGSYQQGDANFGDIRFGGFGFSDNALGQAYLAPQANNYSVAGDIQFNTNQTYNISSTYDLFTVAGHEIGHSLGLLHGALGSVMQGAYPGTKTALATDDINGIRNIYSSNSARSADSYDATASNGSFVTANDLTSLINTNDLTALLTDRDITTTSDLDYYKFTAPSGTSGTLVVKIQSSGLSLLAPSVWVYDSTQAQIGSASGLNQYGTTLTVTLTNVSAGQEFYVKVDGADNTAFGTGKYAVALNFGTGSTPTASSPNTQTANGDPIQGGGAEAMCRLYEARLNQTTANTQETDSNRAVAMDANHNFVAVWSSNGQDGSGYGVYARRFDADGNPLGNELRVNTTTNGDQRYAAVAMDTLGNFMVTWSNYDTAYGDWDVYAQRYNAAGVPQGSEIKVVYEAGDQMYSAVAMDALGNFVVTWAGQDIYWGDWDIYARRYSAAGTALGSKINVAYVSGDQTAPTVAVDALGNFVVAWSSTGGSGDVGSDVLARRYSVLGIALGSSFRVNTTTTLDQKNPALAMDTVGNFVLAWSSNLQDGSGYGVYARRYSALGVALTGEFLINMTTLSDQVQVGIAMDALGHFIITWSNWNQDGSGYGVYAREYDNAATAAGDEILLNLTTEGDQRRSSVAMRRDALGHRHAVIVWSGNGSGDSSGVFGQVFHEGGCACSLCQAAAQAASP